MLKSRTRSLIAAIALAASTTAQAADMPGVSKTEIKIGQTTAYSGPASVYGEIGKIQSAFFEMINQQGGINGRKIKLISLDDGYSPPKSVEQMRKLVEQEQVAFMFNSFGAPTNAAQAKYLNQKKVPQLFVATGGYSWGDYKTLPWSMGWQPSFRTEAQVFTKHALATKPDAKIAVLYQNDDFGKDYVKGVKDVLGESHANQLVKEISYEPTDPTVDSQVISLKGTGVDVIIVAAIPKFAAQTIRKMQELQWNPTLYITGGASAVPATTEPAMNKPELKILSASAIKDLKDPVWNDDASLNNYRDFMKQYVPGKDPTDWASVYAYSVAMTAVQMLKQCGDDLSRENIMKQATNLRNVSIPTLLPGVLINTGPTDHYPIEDMQLMKWNGNKWSLFGKVFNAVKS